MVFFQLKRVKVSCGISHHVFLLVLPTPEVFLIKTQKNLVEAIARH